MMYVIGLFIPFLAIIFESYPRFINRTFGVDIWTHLLYLREFQKRRGIPQKISGAFLVSGEYDYPPIFITILSKFSISFVKKYEFLFSPIWDAIHIYFIFAFSFWYTQNMWFALLVQGIYLLTPIIVIENSSATPRSLGYTLFSVLFISLFYYMNSHQLYLLAIALILGPLILLSHRFTTQGFLFFSIYFSLLYQNSIYIIVLLWSVVSAIIFSKGFYLKVLYGHIGNLRFWNKVIKNRYAHQIRGNTTRKGSSDVITGLYQQFLKFPPFVLSITNPWVPILLLYLFKQNNFTSLETFFFFWIVFSYLLALATTVIEKMRLFGEGQRYLELSAFPTAFLAGSLFSSNFLSSWFFIVIFILISVGAFVTIVVIQYKAIIKDKLRTLTPELINMYNYLHSLPLKPKLLCIPHQITTNTIYHTGCPVFVNADYANIEKITDVYPYIQLPLPLIMKKYKLDMILLNDTYASISELELGDYREIKRFKSIVLLQIYK